MRIVTLALTLTAALGASSCSRIGGDSGLNPLGWFHKNKAPATLEPRGGWKTQNDDTRQLVPQILSAGFKPLNEGKLLVVQVFAPVKGWWQLGIITEEKQPENQLRPSPDGILRLRVVGYPPLAGGPESQLPANPQTDQITVALPISTLQLSRIHGIELRSATGTTSVRP